MKDSSGSMVDFLHFMDKVRIIGEDIHILTGREETLLPCLMMGGKGCMTATSGILPEIMVGIYNAWQEGNYAEARDLQFSVLLVIRAMTNLSRPRPPRISSRTTIFNWPLTGMDLNPGTISAR